MMDFFYRGVKDEKLFKGLAKEIKLVDICQPSYRFMYENWQPEEKEKAKWDFVQDRLLTGNNLEKAVNLPESILFGLDKEGNPLVANGGVEPIMTGMGYNKSRRVLISKDYALFPTYSST